MTLGGHSPGMPGSSRGDRWGRAAKAGAAPDAGREHRLQARLLTGHRPGGNYPRPAVIPQTPRGQATSGRRSISLSRVIGYSRTRTPVAL